MNFQGREAVPIRSRRLPQTIETPVTFDAIPHAYVRYAYARSADSMNSAMDGQDYLCYQHNDQRLVFVVADGVGSSFCGNLAAKLLGDGLLEWFWSLDIAYVSSEAALQEAAVSHLNKMQKGAQREVEEYEIPEEIGGLIRTALEGQRAYGSEAIFAACRIDHPNPLIPEGLLSLFWMGDTRIRVFDQQEGELDLGGSRDLGNRWSTAKGVRGTLSTFMRPLPGISRVASYTDGLSAHEGQLLDYSDARLDREIRAGARLPTSDDVAFIDVVLRTPRYEGFPDPDLPDPNLKRPALEQIWNPQHQDTYELRWAWENEQNFLGQEQKAAFLIQEAGSPTMEDGRTIEVSAGHTTWKPPKPMEPGSYYYRVRAIPRRGPVSPWSELRQTRVAYPPPPAPELTLEGDLSLDWNAEGDALDYVLERSESADFDEVTRVYEGRGSGYTINVGGTKPGVYFFRVRAISDGGPGPFSEPVEVSVTPPAPPRPQLASLSYDQYTNTYLLRWQSSIGATSYEVEEREDERGETRIISLEETSFQVEVDERGVGTYVYRVRACHDWDCSEWSNEQSITITPPAPQAAPAITLEGPDDKGVVRLTWEEVEHVAEYIVETSEDATFNDARMYIRQERSLEVTRREPGALYFRVCGSNSGGEGPWSEPEHVAVAPGTPSWLEVTPGEEDTLSVEWGAVGGRVGYLLEIVTAEGDSREVYRGEETHTEVTPTVGGAVTFRVRAEAPGVTSGWQISDPLQLESRPAGPPIMASEINAQGAVVLAWQAVDEATSYVLEVSRDELFKVLVRTARGEGTQAAIQPPAAGHYWFRLRCLVGDAPGEPGPAVDLTVDKPAAPRLWPVDPVPTDTPFDIAWAGVPGCDHYELEVSAGPRFPEARTKTTKVYHPSQKVTLPGQPRGKFHARVRTLDENGVASVWSDAITIEVS